MVVDVAGESVGLLPERAVWWPAEGTLLVADVHWGKVETFRTYGIPVPDGDLDEGLGRLGALVESTGARRLVVLGDLVHASEGMTPALVERVTAWRRARPVTMVLVRGNHDRHVPELPGAWGIEPCAGVVREGPFAFLHHPVEVEGAYAWCGHLHPAVTLRGRGDSLRAPCFHLGARVGILPAFGSFTGSARVPRGEGRTYAILGRDVVPVPTG